MSSFTKCTKCGNVFKSFIQGTDSEVYLDIAYNCSKCGAMIPVKGTFSWDDDGIIRLLSQDDITPDILRKLKDLSEKAQKEKYSADQFVEEAKEISPLLNFFDKYVKPKNAAEFHTFLSWFMAIIFSLIMKTEEKPSTVIYQPNKTEITNIYSPQIEKAIPKSNAKTSKPKKKKYMKKKRKK